MLASQLGIGHSQELRLTRDFILVVQKPGNCAARRRGRGGWRLLRAGIQQNNRKHDQSARGLSHENSWKMQMEELTDGKFIWRNSTCAARPALRCWAAV